MGFIRKLLVRGEPKAIRVTPDPFIEEPRSFASSYPDVPPPEPRSPEVLAAQWISGDLWCEQMPAIAADLLERGFDAPALRRVAAEATFESAAEAEPLVAQMWLELGVPYPMETRVRQTHLTRQLAREVIAGERSAWSAASKLYWGVWERDWNPPMPGVREILGLLDRRTSSLDRNSVVALNLDVISKFAELGRSSDAVR